MFIILELTAPVLLHVKCLTVFPVRLDGLDGWEVVTSGGDGFCCEEEAAGCSSIKECTGVKGRCASDVV